LEPVSKNISYINFLTVWTEEAVAVSQSTFRTLLSGMEVKPSGRLPSDLVNLFGSLTEGIPALVIAHQTRSLMKWCRWVLPGLRLHEKACEPLVSTVSPEMHWCVWPSSVLSWRPTATRTASSLRWSPHAMIGTAESQSPLWAAAVANNLARWYCLVLASSRDWKVCFATAVSHVLWLILWGWTSPSEVDSDFQFNRDALVSFSRTWHLCGMRFWSDCVLAAEAKKAYYYYYYYLQHFVLPPWKSLSFYMLPPMTYYHITSEINIHK